MKPDRLDRASLRDAWMLHGIGVDCDLMHGEVAWVAELARQGLQNRLQHAGEERMYGCVGPFSGKRSVGR